MDNFIKQTLNDYGWELSLSREHGKQKIQRYNKKYLRKLSRKRLKRSLKKIKDFD